MKKTELGKLAEDKAVVFLQQQGLTVLQRNFYSRFGEIDIILLKNDKALFNDTEIIFCEVRSRKDCGYGTATESINSKKQLKLRKTADYFYLQHQKYQKMPARFDVLIVPTAYEHSSNNIETSSIQWLVNAF